MFSGKIHSSSKQCSRRVYLIYWPTLVLRSTSVFFFFPLLVSRFGSLENVLRTKFPVWMSPSLPKVNTTHTVIKVVGKAINTNFIFNSKRWSPHGQFIWPLAAGECINRNCFYEFYILFIIAGMYRQIH